MNVNQTSKYGKVQAAFEGDSGMYRPSEPMHSWQSASSDASRHLDCQYLLSSGVGFKLRALCRSKNIRGEPINMIDQRPSKWKESNSDPGPG